GDDRVHVHGPPLPGYAPRRLRRLRGALRARPRDPALHRRGAVLRPGVRGRELRGGARDPHRRLRLVLRHRDDDRGPAAHLPGEGSPARVRRPGHAARRLGRLLPGRGPAGVDAVAGEDLPRDVRARRDPGRDPRRRGARVGLARHLAAPDHRRGLHSARPGDLQPRRGVRQAAWQAEAVRMSVYADLEITELTLEDRAGHEAYAAVWSAIVPRYPITAEELGRRRVRKP